MTDLHITKSEVLQLNKFLCILLKYANDGDINDCTLGEQDELKVCEETWKKIYKRVVS